MSTGQFRQLWCAVQRLYMERRGSQGLDMLGVVSYVSACWILAVKACSGEATNGTACSTLAVESSSCRCALSSVGAHCGLYWQSCNGELRRCLLTLRKSLYGSYGELCKAEMWSAFCQVWQLWLAKAAFDVTCYVRLKSRRGRREEISPHLFMGLYKPILYLVKKI